MKSWVGTGEGSARKSVCCAGIGLVIMYYGSVQHNIIVLFAEVAGKPGR